MNYSKQTIAFADHLVSYHAKLDKKTNQYQLNFLDIDDFDLHEFAALLMTECVENSSEATGLDNPLYISKMLPALLKFMHNTTDRDNQYEFMKEWREGIARYHEGTMRKILDERVEAYNDYMELYNKEDVGARRDSGKEVSPW